MEDYKEELNNLKLRQEFKEEILNELSDYFGFSRDELEEHDISINCGTLSNKHHDVRLNIHQMYNTVMFVRISKIKDFKSDNVKMQNLLNFIADTVGDLIEYSKKMSSGETAESYS